MKTVFQLQRNEILQLKISYLFILSKIAGTCSFIHKTWHLMFTFKGGRRGRMVVGFTTTYVINVYRH